MTVATANVLVGAATVSIGDWVTNAGGGSLTDVGHTKSAVTLAPTFEHVEITSERATGTLKMIPINGGYALKVPMLESTILHWEIATKQATGSATGTPPDETLQVGAMQEKYHQIQITGIPGVGTTGARTITLWRCVVESVSEIAFAKGAEQMLEVTFRVLFDDSIAGAQGEFFDLIDA